MIDEFDPLTGDPLPKTNRREIGSNGQLDADRDKQPAIDPATLSSLEEMDREGLIALVRLSNAEQIGYLMLTKAERREAMKLRVYSIAMRSKEDSAALKAANDWLDREDGKATQRIEQKNLNVNVSAAKDMTTEEIMARLSRASPEALQSAGVKLIEGKVERVVDVD